MKDLHEHSLLMISNVDRRSTTRSGKYRTQPAADRAKLGGSFDHKDPFIFGHQVVTGRKRLHRHVPLWTQSPTEVVKFLKSMYPVLTLGATSKEIEQAIKRMPQRQRGIAERQLQRAAIAEIVIRDFYIHMKRQGTIAAELRRRFPLGRKKQLEIVRNVLKKARGYAPVINCKHKTYDDVAA
jgi:hypothetical protein